MDTDLFEVIRTCRAMRRFEDREVPDRIVNELIDLAIRAPSGSNMQSWSFIVVRDRAVKEALAGEIAKGTRWMSIVEEGRLAAAVEAGLVPPDEEAKNRRSLTAFNALAEHFADVPVVICVCVGGDPTPTAARTSKSIRGLIAEYGLSGAIRFVLAGRSMVARGRWASVYPAVQNLLLAARGMGLGAVLTTPQLLGPPGRFEKILGLPNGVDLAAVVPIGYPKGKFGPVRRMPPRVFEDRYGQTRST
jgi:nitroreductase